jgi:hypothetical protein
MTAAEPLHWPKVARRPAQADLAPQTSACPPWLEPGALGALLALPLAVLAGRRLAVRPAEGARMADAVLIARLEGQGASLLLAADAPLADGLITLLFGGTGSGGDLPPLAPASASWATLCTLIAGAVASAIVALEGPPLRVATGNRPATIPPAPAAWIAWTIDALAGPAHSLHLGHIEAQSEPAPAPGETPARWARRVAARAQQVELPVRLRLAEWRLSVARIAALRPGDVLPIQRPRDLAVIVDGTPIATIPAGSIGSSAPVAGGRE